MKKRLLAFALAAALALSLILAGCSPASPSSSAGSTESGSGTSTAGGEAVKAYFVGPMSGGAAWGQAEKGFMQACEDLGWEGQYLAPQSSNSNTDMVNLAETAITNGADVLAISVNDVEMFADMLDRAKEAGVTVIAVTGDDPDRCDAQIGTDPSTIGESAAEALVEAMDGKDIYVATMQTALTNTMQNTARAAFEAKLAELAPDATIVENLECNSNAATASSNLAALKLAHPELNSMMSIDSYAGLGAASYVEENGLENEFVVIGMDDAPEILRAIKGGTMTCTVAMEWYATGYDACTLAQTIREGGTVEYNNDAGARVLFAEDVDAWCEEKGIDINA